MVLVLKLRFVTCPEAEFDCEGGHRVGKDIASSPWNVLVGNALTGNTESVRRLLETIAPNVRKTCRGVLGNAHSDLEDAVQESLIAIVRALPAWRADAHFPYYAAKISLRVALSTRRRTRHQKEAFQLTTVIEDAAGSPDSGASVERGELLRFLIQDLAWEQAEALMLRFFLGYSLEETAQITQVSVNTAKTRIRLAKNALRRKIAADPKAFVLFRKGSR